MTHSTRPAIADAPGAVWQHCRRCGARPFVPSKDAAMCEDCAEELEPLRKYCRVCDMWHLRSDFPPARAICRVAVAAEMRRRYHTNAAYAEATRARSAAWKAANPERFATWRKHYKARQLASTRRYRMRNHERYLESVRQWRQRNPERVLATSLRSRMRRKLRQLQAVRGGI